MKNWKTTTAGIATAVIAVCNCVLSLIDGKQPDILTTATAIMTAIGLIMAKDHNVTGGTVKQ